MTRVKHTYLYTDALGKRILAIERFGGEKQIPPCDRAEIYREMLEKQLKIVVIGWAHMGGNNPKLPTNKLSTR